MSACLEIVVCMSSVNASSTVPMQNAHGAVFHLYLICSTGKNCIDLIPVAACSEGTLHSAMAQHSAVKDIRLVLDRFTGAPRGFAFVHFHTVADASRVLHALQVGSILQRKHIIFYALTFQSTVYITQIRSFIIYCIHS